MSGEDWTILVAVVGLLGLSTLSFSRGRASALGIPLGLLTLDLGGLHLATLANHLTGSPSWSLVDAILTAMSPPLTLHLVVTFVGGRARVRTVERGAFVAFGALALGSLLSFPLPSLRPWVESRTWLACFLVGWIPLLVGSVALLVRHLLGTSDPYEKGRTRLVLAAMAIGGALASTDVLDETGLALPRLAAVGTLTAAVLVAMAALRMRLFDRDLTASTVLYGAVMLTAAAVSYLVVFRLFDHGLAPLAVGAASLTIVVAVVVTELAGSVGRARAQKERLLVMGRFAAQMAHDIKNPLSAIMGAAQVLEPALSAEADKEFLALLLDQTRRIRTIVETYERLGKVEPERVAVNLETIARAVVDAQRLRAPHVRFEVETTDQTVGLVGDPSLLEGALENLVRNAVEALPDAGGKVTVHVDEAVDWVSVRVTDTGQGMDPRRAQRALEEFFTSKPQGSGLGLPFARRVAVAHGGDLVITSALGKGTSIEMRIHKE
jgi:two-component system sensor histidine kinase HydH